MTAEAPPSRLAALNAELTVLGFGQQHPEYRNHLGVEYDALWTLWVFFRARPDGLHVGGGEMNPTYVEWGWVWSDQGMPYFIGRPREGVSA